MTKSLSGAARATIDACRTLFIWLYALHAGWESFHALEVVGFVVLISGTSLYNEIIKSCLPGVWACLCVCWQGGERVCVGKSQPGGRGRPKGKGGGEHSPADAGCLAVAALNTPSRSAASNTQAAPGPEHHSDAGGCVPHPAPACCVSCCCTQAPRSTTAGRRPCRATAAAGAHAPLVQPGTQQKAAAVQTTQHLLCRCCRVKQKRTQRKDGQQQQVLCCQQPRLLLLLVLQRRQQAGGAQRPRCLSDGLPQPTREQQQPRRVSPQAAAAAGRITWRAACGWGSTRCRRSPWQLPGGWQRGMMGRRGTRVTWRETTLCQSLAAAITPAASWGAPAWGAAWMAVREGACRARSGVQALAVEVEHWQRTQTAVGVAVG